MKYIGVLILVLIVHNASADCWMIWACYGNHQNPCKELYYSSVGDGYALNFNSVKTNNILASSQGIGLSGYHALSPTPAGYYPIAMTYQSCGAFLCPEYGSAVSRYDLLCAKGLAHQYCPAGASSLESGCYGCPVGVWSWPDGRNELSNGVCDGYCTCSVGTWCWSGANSPTDCHTADYGYYAIGGSSAPVALTGCVQGTCAPILPNNGFTDSSGYCLNYFTCAITPDTEYFSGNCRPIPDGYWAFAPIHYQTIDTALKYSAAPVCTRCNPGSYSSHLAPPTTNNWCTPCAAGYFATGDGHGYPPATTSACNAACTCQPGYYCPEGSTSPVGIACERGFFCPGNIPPGGGMSISMGNLRAQCTSPQVGPGWFCEAKTSLNQMGPPYAACPTGQTCAIQCSQGNYCTGGAAVPIECVFPASSGYYCPIGLSIQTGVLCPAGYYCIKGIATACAVAPGNYCKQGGGVALGDACPQGSWCAGGTAANLTCTGVTPPGSWCPPSTKSSAGTPCADGNYCEGGSAAQIPCGTPVLNPGYACFNQSTSSVGRPCPAGYSCPGGSGNLVVAPESCRCSPQYYCPAMHTSMTCDACPSLYYCVGGTADKAPCTTQGYYCGPGQSSATANGCVVPLSFGAGRYCPGGFPGSNGSDYMVGGTTHGGILCPATYWCSGGMAPAVSCASIPSTAPGKYCPAGTTSSTGSTCPSGNYCSGGIAQPLPCTCTAGTYCAEGAISTTSCTTCTASNYCTGGGALPLSCAAPNGNACVSGASSPLGNPCPIGSTCAGGSTLPTPCPLGRYCSSTGTLLISAVPCAAGYAGTSTGQSTAQCSGPCTCAPGKYCAAGSSDVSGISCPHANTCAGGTAQPVPCSGPAGTFCPGGTAVPIGCPPGLFCTGNTAMPQTCNIQGYYCGANSTNAYGEVVTGGRTACSAGTYWTL